MSLAGKSQEGQQDVHNTSGRDVKTLYKQTKICLMEFGRYGRRLHPRMEMRRKKTRSKRRKKRWRRGMRRTRQKKLRNNNFYFHSSKKDKKR
jgi:hypothetical protein